MLYAKRLTGCLLVFLGANCLTIVAPSGNKGISHGDIIDLTRKDIPGFDVCEFYVDLVNDLKNKGL
ncbi:MAG: hypothetical protein FWF88_00320 [Peptococcaceae bacterium]|nr:hypothetical protein [Peptococcaceae bacterium]